MSPIVAAPLIRRFLCAPDLGELRFAPSELSFVTDSSQVTLYMRGGSGDGRLDRAEMILRRSFSDSPRRVSRWPGRIYIERYPPANDVAPMPHLPSDWPSSELWWQRLVLAVLHDWWALDAYLSAAGLDDIAALRDGGWVRLTERDDRPHLAHLFYAPTGRAADTVLAARRGITHITGEDTA